MDSTSALAELRTQITQDLANKGRHAWFFPAWDGVRGWEGTGPVCFVALNPSMGHNPKKARFPTQADRLLYHHLALNGFADAHLTDTIKFKAVNNEVPAILADETLVSQHRAWLIEELQIVQPRLIVSLGRGDPYNLLCRWLPGDTRLQRIVHYAWAWRWRKDARFEKEMAELMECEAMKDKPRPED